ncbi:Fructosamine kinase-domain-containing protein [Hypoxylon cercidicola]|nr:Fructosamine kinase-domain-containing protein [Hypoxylon cercidicola]
MADEQPKQMTEPLVPIEAIQIIDPEVLKKLRGHVGGIEEFSAITIAGHGSSLWTRTARIDTEFMNERREAIRKSFFLKTTYGANGKEMVVSEEICMLRLHEMVPDLAPKPLSSGTYSSVRDIHFLLCEFRSMDDKLPPPEALAPKVAELHRESVSCPMFGLSHSTFHGSVRVDHGFSKTWETYFTNSMKKLFDQEQSVQGPNEEIRQMIEPFFEKVIPRLLRPLEGTISPCLIHGDFWHGNVGTDKETGKPVIFDAASFYAHNEYELGVWRQPWNKINSDYRKKYHTHFPPSEPVEDCDDRNALYAIRVNALDSILYQNEQTYREMLIAGMRELIDKFPGGFEEWETSQHQSNPSKH